MAIAEIIGMNTKQTILPQALKKTQNVDRPWHMWRKQVGAG